MDLFLYRSPLRGTVAVPSSKSAVHRLLVCSAFADSPTYVDFNGLSDDISATICCLPALGCRISPTPSGVLVEPALACPADPALDCGECGTTARFMLPVAAAAAGRFSITGRPGLCRRPIGELGRVLAGRGCVLSASALPLRADGRLQPGEFRLPGNISSQYISGLLLALPLLGGDSEIVLTTALSSASYVDMTLDTMARFGVTVRPAGRGWHVPGGQRYRSPGRISAEGDWSAAAAWLFAGALSGPVTVSGLSGDSRQPDRAAVGLLRRFGAHVECTERSVTISRGHLAPLCVDIDQCPDLMPVLAAALACCPGRSRICNAARLRLKESDRIAAMAAALGALGIRTAESGDSLDIYGGCPAAGTVSSCGDHRIAMAAAVLSQGTALALAGAGCTDKSYPGFFADYAALGGKYSRIRIGGEFSGYQGNQE